MCLALKHLRAIICQVEVEVIFSSNRFLDALASLKTMLDIQYYRVFQSITNITEYYRVLQNITEYYRVLQNIRDY